MPITGSSITRIDAALSGGGVTALLDAENSGILSINSGDNTKFDLTACKLQFVDAFTDPFNPTIKMVDIPSQTAVSIPTLTTNSSTFLYIDGNGDFVFKTELQNGEFLRENVGVGIINHPNLTNIENVSQASLVSFSNTIMSLADMSFCQLAINCAFGGQNIISGSSGTLKLTTSGGCWYYHGINSGNSNKNPNVIETPQQTEFQFFLTWRTTDGSGTKIIVTDSMINDVYDDGTAVQADAEPQGILNNNQWVNNRIYKIVNENQAGALQFAVQIGQVKYNSQDEARLAIPVESYEVSPVLQGTTPNATVTMRGGAIDLTDIADAIFTQATPPRATF